MADNVNITPGSGAIVAAENVGSLGPLVQRIKMVLGATDVDNGNVSSTNPMPTNDANAITALNTIATNTGTASTDTIVSGTITALNGTVSVNAQGAYTISASITGTWVATLLARGQLADGTWAQLPMYIVTTTPPYQQAMSLAANATVLVIGGGYTTIQIYSSAFTSGTVAVALDASLGQQLNCVSQLGNWVNRIIGNAGAILDQAPGSAAPANALQIGGSDGTNLRALSMTAKGTQGAFAATVQDLKDSGRNVTNYFMASQVISTATETLQSLTGYKSGAAVGATTTPAVVTSGKTYRINRVVITYVAVATAGAIQVNLRANLSGTVVIGSPLVESWLIGTAAATAGIATTVTIDIPDGLEFPAGTGIGITVLGVSATGTATAVGYAKVGVKGFEY